MFQENGFVREYRIGKKPGIPKDRDPNDWDSLDRTEQARVIENYASFVPGAGVNGYYFPDQKVNEQDQLNYIDLTIYHPKYNATYEDHVPIELSSWFCTFSQANYPFMKDLWWFVRKQPLANVIGELGKRAGLLQK